MNTCCHFSEVVKLLPGLYANHREDRVRRLKANTILIAAKSLHRKVAIYASYDDIARCWTQRAVNHEQIPVVDSLPTPPLRARPLAARGETK